MIIYNQEMLETAIKDLRYQFEKCKRLNLSYEKAHKEKTLAQSGFVYGALIANITEYLIEEGNNVDLEDVKDKLYKDVSRIVPEMLVDKEIFGGKPRIKRWGEMDREIASKFIDGIFSVLDIDSLYNGLMLHPSIAYNWVFHLDKEELRLVKNRNFLERDEYYLNYIREQPCIICGIQHKSEAHHIRDTRTAGVAIKSPDWYAIPLCHDCHMKVAHGVGFKESMNWLPIDLMDFCKLCYSRWLNKI